MPEYRRFVAYFYEYIEGRKQKNAGFVKVELRNGMWRLLLRLTAAVQPEPPIQVYGFVREKDRLQGLLLGTMRPVREIAEEWAFRADAPVGGEKYRMGELAGLWIGSGDGRCFVTVWDDEGIDPARFVTELPEEQETAEPVGSEDGEPEAETAAGASSPDVLEKPVPAPGEDTKPKLETAAGVASPDVLEELAPALGEGLEPKLETAADVSAAGAMLDSADAGQEAADALAAGAMLDSADTGQEAADVSAPGAAECLDMVQEETKAGAGVCDPGIVEELFSKRTPFQPFSDGELVKCVMILPCDIVRLQQENWRVGRSSFLQHGFYQHRHILLGKTAAGLYVLGVPGIQNPQEAYMARMFGYERFRESAKRSCGQVFGYWCRELRQDCSGQK